MSSLRRNEGRWNFSKNYHVKMTKTNKREKIVKDGRICHETFSYWNRLKSKWRQPFALLNSKQIYLWNLTDENVNETWDSLNKVIRDEVKKRKNV